MSFIQTMQTNPILLVIFIAVISACMGSLINMMIYRFPIMLNREWRKECKSYLNLPITDEPKEPYNFFLPRSHCPECKTVLKWWHNIPIISYLLLLGRCAYCKSPIPLRYFFVEMLAFVTGILAAVTFGFELPLAFALIFIWFLIAMIFIDIDHHLLPDELTLGLLWIGLLANLFHSFSTPQSAIVGAILGYGIFYLVSLSYKLISKRDGLGLGDAKLLAAFGAYLGWQLIPFIILAAAILGCGGGIFMMIKYKDRHHPFAFGPYLAVAGFIAMFWGDAIIRWYISLVVL